MCHIRGFVIIHNALVAAGIILRELQSEGELTNVYAAGPENHS